MNRTRDLSRPDELAELFELMSAHGVTLTPMKGDFGFGCWGFQGRKGANGVEVFWDGKDGLLEVRRLFQEKWELDSVHPVAASSAVGLAGDILLSKLSDEKTST